MRKILFSLTALVVLTLSAALPGQASARVFGHRVGYGFAPVYYGSYYSYSPGTVYYTPGYSSYGPTSNYYDPGYTYSYTPDYVTPQYGSYGSSYYVVPSTTYSYGSVYFYPTIRGR